MYFYLRIALSFDYQNFLSILQDSDDLRNEALRALMWRPNDFPLPGDRSDRWLKWRDLVDSLATLHAQRRKVRKLEKQLCLFNYLLKVWEVGVERCGEEGTLRGLILTTVSPEQELTYASFADPCLTRAGGSLKN